MALKRSENAEAVSHSLAVCVVDVLIGLFIAGRVALCV